ncbi:Putative hydrolase [Fulvivirga imtechensis AK7]|uniref:Putative hydrolase n=1 Tax=Fulvivirga imtechensis AK7 TaxID=1237149 RepID=L8K1U8_9BACT|nr:alpha/beta family hydrolase [Fulvivirga imtechensis]ELR73914.1 Putative hydrolase [Fulvivirga imtechensis AK7]
MSQISFKLHISEGAGAVTCEIIEADKPIAILALAHGAGAGMHHSFMLQLAAALASSRISTIRFNFPYMEQGKKRPDTPKIAQETIYRVILETHHRYPALPIYAGGKSFGGRMTSQLAAFRQLAELKGLVFFGFPLHPPGKPSVQRADHLQQVPIPMLFLQGTRDKLATPELMKQTTEHLDKSKLIFLDGADHSFQMLKSSGRSQQEVFNALASLTAKWVMQNK